MQENSEFGVCKFCLSEGLHKDITNGNRDDGERENYCDIISECFNIFISTSWTHKALICAHCVARLRAAVLFRELVLQAAQDLSARTQDTSTPIAVPAQDPVAVKMEPNTVPSDEIEIVEHGLHGCVKPEPRAVPGLTPNKQKDLKPNKSEMKRVAPYPIKVSSINVQILPSVGEAPLSCIIMTKDVHPTSKTFGCPACGKVFLQLAALRKHTAEHAELKLRTLLLRKD